MSGLNSGTAVVVGVGAKRGLGAALCRRFAAEGYHVLVAGRTLEKLAQVAKSIGPTGGSAEAITVDTTREDDVIRLFDQAMSPGDGRAAADVVIFNAGNNRRIDFKESAEQFEQFWRVGCFGGFLVGREAARRLAPLGRGTIIFTGASASLRGKPEFAHFAAAKAGLRMIAQSMAREYGPLGIHVAHVVIDGGINGDRLLSRMPTLATERGEDGLLTSFTKEEAFMIRKAKAVWRGTGRDGSGDLSTDSGVLASTPYSFKTRFENEKGTNPEELIAAAHAGCFTMALAFAMQAAGLTPTELSTEAAVTLEPEGKGFKISRSALTLRAKAPNLDEAKFADLARDAEKNCPVSKVLNAGINLDAKLI